MDRFSLNDPIGSFSRDPRRLIGLSDFPVEAPSRLAFSSFTVPFPCFELRAESERNLDLSERMVGRTELGVGVDAVAKEEAEV